MSTSSLIDRTLRWKDKCQAISVSTSFQCSNFPYEGEHEEDSSPDFCFAHRKPQSRKCGEVNGWRSTEADVKEDIDLLPTPLQFPTSQPQQASDFASNPQFPITTSPTTYHTQFHESLISVIAQLDRIELRGASKEDVQRLEITCASKASLESLETRVQHLERAVSVRVHTNCQTVGIHRERRGPERS